MLSTNIISKGTMCLNNINDQYQSHIIISCMACNACILLYDLWPVLLLKLSNRDQIQKWISRKSLKIHYLPWWLLSFDAQQNVKNP